MIVAPTTPTQAYKLGSKIDDPKAMYMGDVLTIPVNLAGLPAMSINAGFNGGLPIGLQIIGQAFDEQTIYQLAYAFEQTNNFAENVPAIGKDF